MHDDAGGDVVPVEAHQAAFSAADPSSRASRRGRDQVAPYVPLNPFKLDQKFEAACFFFDSFAWIYSGVIQNCDPSGDIPPNTPLATRALTNAITSVGMANISSIQRSQPLRMAAWREYAEALKWTNAAISDRGQATEDATLAAILCLSMFEVCGYWEAVSESMADFVQHTNGALALLALRGDSQLQRQEGLQLFFALRSEVMISCILKRYHFPSELITLSEKATRLPEVCDLRIRHENNLKTIQTDLLSRSFALDSKIAALENTFPPESMYRIVAATPGQSFQVKGSSRIFPLDGSYHIYAHWFLPNMWNNYRYARILTNEIILNQLKLMTVHQDGAKSTVPTQEFKDICYRSCTLTRKLAHDICATVPYMLGLIDDHNKGQTKSAAGKLTLLFPLYVAANVDGPGSVMCDWAQDCLTKLGRGMGIDQALILVDMLWREDSMTAFVDAMREMDNVPMDAGGKYIDIH
ncbi:hypothetical protein PISL3812_05806 [Talaromyces islandicus]|uniref:Uncharacterized protein n=1 Tax=Talaromyces islandicus TaxID=28573 RepID=A0A0U1M019_TALIS|nr:hypothetical protein PISL3812_05806 [Talaromyces islandicus]